MVAVIQVERGTQAEVGVATEVLASVAPLVERWEVQRYRDKTQRTELVALRVYARRGSPGARRAASIAAVVRGALRLAGGPAVDVGMAGIAGRRAWIPVLAGLTPAELVAILVHAQWPAATSSR